MKKIKRLVKRILFYGVQAGIIAFELVGLVMIMTISYYFMCLAGTLAGWL